MEQDAINWKEVEAKRELQVRALEAAHDVLGDKLMHPLDLLAIVRGVLEVQLPIEEAVALGLAYKALKNRLQSALVTEEGYGPGSWEEVFELIEEPVEPAELSSE